MIVSRFIDAEVYGHCWLTKSRQESMFNEHLERPMENVFLFIHIETRAFPCFPQMP